MRLNVYLSTESSKPRKDTKITMAKNAPVGDNRRIGAVCDRSQAFNPVNKRWVKRGEAGRFIDQKADSRPFKGVRKEK